MKRKLSNEPKVGNGILRSIRRTKRRFACLCVVLAILSFAVPAFAEEPLFDLNEVADGVYIALARLKHGVISNAAVIILEDGVLIVDTHSRPSTAYSLIDQIKTVTDKPVRWVVNTHFHADHFRGNAAYLQTYPQGLEIISSESARQSILNRGLPRIKADISRQNKRIESVKRELADTTDPDRQDELKQNISQSEQYREELKDMLPAVPTMTFENSLTLYDKDRVIQLLFLGNAHTDNDIIVYLPKEKVLVTGDLLHAWVPYMADSYPYEWIHALEALRKLDFDTIISGHGDVMQGEAMILVYRDYLTDLMAQVAELHGQGASLQEIKQKVDLLKYEPLMGLDEAGTGLRAALDSHIQKAYRVITGAQ